MEHLATTENKIGTWRELLTGTSAPVVAVLAGGTLLEASTVYLTTSLLPTVVDDIGGEDFYAWTMTAFLMGSIVSAMLVSRTLNTRGSVQAYIIAFGLFGLGSVVASASPVMGMLLAGRAVQGLGGGLLAGLGYALIQSALPERLWSRAAALVSAMWGVGNIVGPLAGGLFAEFGAWRAAFLALTAVAIFFSILTLVALPRTAASGDVGAVPIPSLLVLTSAIAAVSMASVMPTVVGMAAAGLVGVVLTVVFLRIDRRAGSGVLAAVTFDRGSSLRWAYLTIAVLAFGIGTEAFLPRFGQELGGLGPLLAGFFGASLSFGWSVTQVFSASVNSPRRQRLLVIAGPVVLAIGLVALALTTMASPPLPVVVAWFALLFIAGAGIGTAFPHLTVAALASADGEEGSKAAAGVNTVFIIASAFSAALAGILVNLGDSEAQSMRTLMLVFGAIALIGIPCATRAVRSIG